MSMKELAVLAHQNSLNKGWWVSCEHIDGLSALDVQGTVPEKIALIHSEASEALEEYRNGKVLTEVTVSTTGKPEGFPTELADVVIRVFDLAEALGIDIEAAVLQKMEYNATRPHRHGGKRA